MICAHLGATSTQLGYQQLAGLISTMSEHRYNIDTTQWRRHFNYTYLPLIPQPTTVLSHLTLGTSVSFSRGEVLVDISRLVLRLNTHVQLAFSAWHSWAVKGLIAALRLKVNPIRCVRRGRGRFGGGAALDLDTICWATMAAYQPFRDPARTFTPNGRPMRKPRRIAMRLSRWTEPHDFTVHESLANNMSSVLSLSISSRSDLEDYYVIERPREKKWKYMSKQIMLCTGIV